MGTDIHRSSPLGRELDINNMSSSELASEEARDAKESATTAHAKSGLINPVPMRIPAVLVNPKQSASQRPSAHQVATRSALGRAPGSKNERHIGRRKLLRRINATMSNHNPHAVRPKASDYSPGSDRHDIYRGTFRTPLPPYVREVGKGAEIRDGREARDWRKQLELDAASTVANDKRNQMQVGDRGLEDPRFEAGSATPASIPDVGVFTMSLQEARFFIHRRAGCSSKLDRNGQHRETARSDAAAAAASEEAEPAPSQSVTPMQDLVNRIEDEFGMWKEQVVYQPQVAGSDGSPLSAMKPNPHPRTVVQGEDFVTSAPLVRVEEHYHLPQSVSYHVPDNFDRLAVHCLARLWGLRSFSKSLKGLDDIEMKLTWILKPPTKNTRSSRGNVASGGSSVGAASPSNGRLNPLLAPIAAAAAASRSSTGASGGVSAPQSEPPAPQPSFSRTRSGMETPPTTDVGTSASEYEYEEDTASSANATDEEEVASVDITSSSSSNVGQRVRVVDGSAYRSHARAELSEVGEDDEEEGDPSGTIAADETVGADDTFVTAADTTLTRAGDEEGVIAKASTHREENDDDDDDTRALDTSLRHLRLNQPSPAATAAAAAVVRNEASEPLTDDDEAGYQGEEDDDDADESDDAETTSSSSGALSEASEDER
ncbi:unnamed protein product [Jaminaea pallidilutea]